MKKICSLLIILLATISLGSCRGGKGCDLLVLSWGEYIAFDAIKGFSDRYGVSVRVLPTESNEAMYTFIQGRASEYDVAIPSDYMIHQMMEEGMLHKLDYSLIPNYNDDLIIPELKALMEGDDMLSYSGYYMPYFWGSLGIMYSNKRFPNMGEIVHKNGFNILYDESLWPSGARIAMYNGSRDALASAEIYLGYSMNSKSHEEIDRAMSLIKSKGFKTWGTDDLKIEISRGTIDACLVYTGDYFDAYYADIEGGNIENTKSYGIYAPEKHNNIFLDAMVIPKTSTNVDLAHKFINYMIDYEVALLNASYVGYCPTIAKVYNEIMTDPEFADVSKNRAYSPVNILSYPGSRGEVYRYLGSETFRYIERKYTEVIF